MARVMKIVGEKRINHDRINFCFDSRALVHCSITKFDDNLRLKVAMRCSTSNIEDCEFAMVVGVSHV